MATYNVFREENRSNGYEEHIGTVDAESTAQAAMEAAGQFECDNLHHLTVHAESTTLTEIESILQSAGPTFDGGADADRKRIAREWDAEFEPAAVRLWVAAGCWDVSTAVELDDAGFSPTDDKLRFVDGRDGDAMYALCNGDVTIDDVTW